MKKLCIWLLLIAILVATPLWLLGFAYRQTNTFKNIERAEETEKFHNVPKKIDIAVFGSSHSRDAFRFAPDGKTMFNFSLSAQTPQYDLMMMKEYSSHFHSGTTVILTISYLSPYWTDTEADFLSKQPRYYRALSPWHIVDVDLPQYLLERFSPVLTEDLPAITEALFHDEALDAPVDETHQTSPQVMESECERVRYTHWQKLVQKSFPAPNTVMMDAYREMLQLCRENGWNAILVTTPYLAEYQTCYPAEFYPAFQQLATELATEFCVPYYDFSHSEIFATRYDLFKNIDHLNLAGCELFDKLFFSKLGY